ncbi:MAG TPA: hypothetical protein VLJ17_24440 [Xanthobacteraceae bacterium]|nr:hypothetical protein [Xanthobacteraceae bacterium]
MTIKQRYLYRDAGDHIAFRDASIYVIDNRDKRGLDGRRLYIDEHPQFVGEEPPWVAPGHFLLQPTIEKAADEIDFDHKPTDEELSAAFPNFQKYKMFKAWLENRRKAERDAADKAASDARAAEMKAFEAHQAAVAAVLAKA